MFNKLKIKKMENFVNFKKFEVTGSTKQEAYDKAPFKIFGDATHAYKAWVANQKTAITEVMIKDFLIDQLKSKTKMAPGLGLAITVESASADTRERPYKFEPAKDANGRRKWKSVYQLKTADGNVLAEAETQSEIKKLARDLYSSKKVTEDTTCIRAKKIIEGTTVAFNVKYAPSKNFKIGRFIMFGVEA